MAKNDILARLNNQRILLLGFGREGKSTLRFINENIRNADVTIADANENLDTEELKGGKYRWIVGENYLDTINDYDVVIQSPGISLKNHLHRIQRKKITSQTDLFLQAYGCQCIGITGTKGKSTTASLVYHVLQSLHAPVLFAGNIGIPLFDIIPQIGEKEKIVIELSSHQLEFIRKAPAISVLLNLFEEHLDHYNSFYDYQSAKLNIAICQNGNDSFIYNTSDDLINQLLKTTTIASQRYGFSYAYDKAAVCYVKDNYFVLKRNSKEEKLFAVDDTFPLKGNHNLQNVSAAILAVLLAYPVSDYQQLKDAVMSFRPLPHRLEYVATIDDVIFYNDSISTIPQATIAALQALKNVNTLILGGMDRGIDYSPLKEIIMESEVKNFIFTGKAGERMMQLCQQPENKNFYLLDDYKKIVDLAKKITAKHCICLLSPAASSYDAFKNFEERGEVYKSFINENSKK
jgi:UDP-N-acetylmuramoylalanine--D-glutamate ligase